MTPAGIAAGALVVAAGACCGRGLRQARWARVRRRLGPALGVRRRLLRLPPPPGWLASALADAVVPLEVDRAWAVWLGAGCFVVTTAAVAGGPVLAALVVPVAVFAPRLLLRSQRHRLGMHLEGELPGALEGIARGLRSGGSLRQALTETAGSTPGVLGEELRIVAAEATGGANLVAALEAFAGRCPLPGVRLAVSALCLGAEAGGAQARAVDGVAATLRERLAVAGEVRALSAQTRASMVVIALAPLAFCAFASATDRRTSTFLFRSPIGLACVVAGVGLDAAGAVWMRRLSRVAP